MGQKTFKTADQIFSDIGGKKVTKPTSVEKSKDSGTGEKPPEPKVEKPEEPEAAEPAKKATTKKAAGSKKKTS